MSEIFLALINITLKNKQTVMDFGQKMILFWYLVALLSYSISKLSEFKGMDPSLNFIIQIISKVSVFFFLFYFFFVLA